MAITCGNPDCKVAETQKCVEGLELALCTHYGKEPEAGSAGNEQSHVQLPLGSLLDPIEASELMKRTATRVLAIVGPADAGKTSMIAALYEMFQVGPVGGNYFAGSRTLQAFESTCHDARAISQRATPHTARTPRGGVTYYHLDIKSAVESVRLLLADRAGEEYRSTADDISNAQDFLEVARADTVALLVDGERLQGIQMRHNVRSELLLILQALLDGDLLGRGQRLAIVLTKMDVVDASARKVDALSDFESLQQAIRNTFLGAFADIVAMQIAASPRSGEFERGHGLTDFLEYILTSREPKPAAVDGTIVSRAFERLS